jgi:RNA polymerase sigma-70 factor (ECF subfamily)
MEGHDSKNQTGRVKDLLEVFLGCRTLLAWMVGCLVRPDEIEDIVQETFMLSYAASRSQEIRDPQAFMIRVARNVALDHIKRADRKLAAGYR